MSLLPMPASGLARLRLWPRSGRTVSLQALLTAGAISPGIPTLTIVAECALAGPLIRLLPVAAIGRALSLI